MSQFKADRPVTQYANGAMAFRWRFVVLTADYTVGYAGNAARAYGVLMDTAQAAGDPVPVAKRGSGPTIKVEAGAAFAAGALLMPNASGQAITATGGSPISARAIQAATAAGDLIEAEWLDGTA